jgi:hypothetical protein
MQCGIPEGAVNKFGHNIPIRIFIKELSFNLAAGFIPA